MAPVAFVVVAVSVGLVTGGCVATAAMSLWTKNTPLLIRRKRTGHRRQTMVRVCTNTPTEMFMLASGGEESAMDMENS